MTHIDVTIDVQRTDRPAVYINPASASVRINRPERELVSGAALGITMRGVNGVAAATDLAGWFELAAGELRDAAAAAVDPGNLADDYIDHLDALETERQQAFLIFEPDDEPF